MKNKYMPSYFKENLPEWKRKKDSVLVRIFYRPVSFVFSSFFVNCEIYANQISYFSLVLGVLACVMFLLNNYVINIVGALLINIWLILDCADGNIARSVKKQPFGEFADGISSYILICVLFICIGINVYNNGGLILNKFSIYSILLGCIAANSDSLMRLVHQKYVNVERDMIDNKIIKIKKTEFNMNDISSLKVRLKSELGLGGCLPFLVLLGTIFKSLDLVLLYGFVYCFGSCILNIMIYIFKAIKNEKCNI